MKHIIKLDLTIEIECSEQYADQLKADPITAALKHCFKNNSRTITKAEVVDEELIDNTVSFNRTTNRIKASMTAKDVETKKVPDLEEGDHFISLL
jgi:hypothetical protein